MFVAEVQISFSSLQSLLPHAQEDGLGAEPSVVAQVGNWLHLFWDRSQCMLPAVSQSTLPQAQADGLGAEPSVVAHAAGGREQVLDAAVQTMPVPCPSPLILVHTAFPHLQGSALLGRNPSVFVQAGAVRVHMHVSEGEHAPVFLRLGLILSDPLS